MIPHLHLSSKKSEFVEGIPAKLFSSEDAGFNMVLAVDKIHDLVGLGSILDRVAILCERGLLKQLVGLSSYCVYDSHNVKPFAESDVLRPRNFVGVRAASLEAFLPRFSKAVMSRFCTVVLICFRRESTMFVKNTALGSCIEPVF